MFTTKVTTSKAELQHRLFQRQSSMPRPSKHIQSCFYSKQTAIGQLSLKPIQNPETTFLFSHTRGTFDTNFWIHVKSLKLTSMHKALKATEEDRLVLWITCIK